MDTRKKTERELMEKLKAGDIKAFDYFYHEYKKKTFYFVKKIIKIQEEAEGIIQEVFLKLWDKRKDIDLDKSISSWLFTIAYNLTIDRVRSLSKHKEFTDLLKYSNKDSNLDTEKVVNFNFLQQKLKEITDELPEQRKKIYDLSRNKGLSNKEIAARLNISINTVENQLVSALKVIRVELKKLIYITLWL